MSETGNRILIADDHEENRYILGRILRAANYSCAEAATGTRALEAALDLPDLIILDVQLPDMSGFDVCQKLKKDARTASIPVLQISAAFVSPEDRVRALDAGADGYLTHPIDRTVLTATVRSLLRLRAAEQQARKAADQWATTFNGLSEGLAILDENDCLIRWNGAFESMLGSVLEIGVGKTVGAYLDTLQESGEAQQGADGDRFTNEFALDGRTLRLSAGPIANADNRSERIVIVSDITDRRLAEYALRTAEKLAATGKLANAIAHEINNPLEALINLVFLAQTSREMDFIQGLLVRANEEIARIARITKQTLAFHRDTQHPAEVDLGRLLTEVVAMYERPSSVKRVRLVVDSQPTPPVLGFSGQLNQVFGNLVRNASEAAPSGSEVVVRVRTIDRAGKARARVTIHDRGKGIPRSVQKKMFDPFFTTKELKGSGLGLWVSRSLIAKHKGSIRFRTSERGGTTFAVFLPLAEAAKSMNEPTQRTLLEA